MIFVPKIVKISRHGVITKIKAVQFFETECTTATYWRLSRYQIILLGDRGTLV